MQAYVGNEGYGFISYAYRDLEKVRAVAENLQNDGVRLWMDCTYDTNKTAKSGEGSYQEPANIPKIIDGAKVVIVFISPGAFRSMNVKNEISYALNKGKNIIAVYLEECELPDSFKIALGGQKTVNAYSLGSKEAMAAEIKNVCPGTIYTLKDQTADEFKTLFLGESEQEKKPEQKVSSQKKEEYNYYVVVKRLDGTDTTYRAAIRDRAMIGRAQPGNAINFDDLYVARLHCELKLVDEQLFIRDNNSTNHTYCENNLVSSEHFERVSATGRYRIGRFFYSFSLEKRLKPSEDESRTVFYKQMFDEFQDIAKGANQISTKSLFMDQGSIVNQKFNEALKKWRKLSGARYIIDFLCDQLGIKFEREDRYRIYEEVNLYNSLDNLSKETYDNIYKIAETLAKYAVEKLSEENASRYIGCLGKYTDPEYIAQKIVEYDSEFVLYFVTPILDLDEEQLSYLLKHVLKRKGIDYYNPDEFLLWVAVRVETDSRYALLIELKSLYFELKNSSVRQNANSDDFPVTVYIGYNAEENYLEGLNEEINVSDVRTSPLVAKMLRWHITLEKKTGSSATVRFYELYNEINTLYSPEIADLKVMKKNINDAAEVDPSESSDNKRGSYNVSLKYDGTGKIIIKYNAKENFVIPAGLVAFKSEGRFNRINGQNDFALTKDAEFKVGSGEVTLEVKCVSEKPFQMAKLRKKGTASIAEKDTISIVGQYAEKFDGIQISNKPICIFFEKFSSTGDIREYLYSNVDRKDLFDEWFCGDNKLSLDMSLFEAEWFTDSRLTDEIIENFDEANGYEQRCGILLMLYMKFCKENFDTEIPYQKLIRKFSKMVDYEMDEIRFEGINYGNSFDCLLCYLMMTSSPVDNLRLLYKEAFK